VLENNDTQEISHTVAGSEEMMSRYIPEVVSGVALRDFYSNWLYGRVGSADLYDPSFNNFTNDYMVRASVRRAITEGLELNRTFALGFNNDPTVGWYVLSSNEIDPDLQSPYAFATSINPGPNSWLVHIEYTTGFWRITSRGVNYVFESQKDCKFFFLSDYQAIDPNTGQAGSDTINILRTPNGLKNVTLVDNLGATYRTDSDLVLKLEAPFTYDDGFNEPSRIKVRFNDRQANGIPDVPHTYQFLKKIDATNTHIVHWNTTDTDGYPVQRLIRRLEPGITRLSPGEYGYVERVVSGYHYIDIYKGNPGYLVPKTSDIVLANTYVDNHVTNATATNGAKFTLRPGVNGLIYQWRHFAPSDHRIDPAVSNIIDIFVLTRQYNDAMISWRNSGALRANMPSSPSELSLTTTFSQLEEFKMFSDEIIWRPVKFKLLFGQSADAAHRGKFKIVRLAGTSMSDGEIKSKVVLAIRDFFEVNNWNFGETFFFSELGAYIHRQLSTAISSVEIVPVLNDSYFGNLREIRCAPDELFFATTQVSDIDIITANTPTNLRIR
jgi:hypothetical protein